MFCPIWINVAQFALSAQSGSAWACKKGFFEEDEGMPLPRERLCQDFEQGAPLTPNPCQGSVPGKDRGFPLVFNKPAPLSIHFYHFTS